MLEKEPVHPPCPKCGEIRIMLVVSDAGAEAECTKCKHRFGTTKPKESPPTAK